MAEGTEQPAVDWGRIDVGSNVFENTPAVLIVRGEPQVFVERGANDEQLLLTMDVYDRDRNHVAKLARNAWVFNQSERYSVTTNPKSLQLLDSGSGVPVPIVTVEVIDRDRIDIPQAYFYAKDGTPISVSPERMQIGGPSGITLSGNRMVNCGGGIAIG